VFRERWAISTNQEAPPIDSCSAGCLLGDSDLCLAGLLLLLLYIFRLACVKVLDIYLRC